MKQRELSGRGSAVEDSSKKTQKRFCSQCGTPVRDNEKFCRECGALLKSVPVSEESASKEHTSAQNESSEQQTAASSSGPASATAAASAGTASAKTESASTSATSETASTFTPSDPAPAKEPENVFEALGWDAPDPQQLKSIQAGKRKKLSPRTFIILVVVAVIALPMALFGGCTACGVFDDDITYEDDSPHKLYWPYSGLAQMLPEPDAEYGDIEKDKNSDFRATVEEVQPEYFADYAKECQAYGFSLNVTQDETSFSAENDEGCALHLTYSEDNMRMKIKLTAPTVRVRVEVECDEASSEDYDIWVVIDDDWQGTIRKGESDIYDLDLTSGKHTLRIESEDNYEVYGTMPFTVSGECALTFSANCKKDRVKITLVQESGDATVGDEVAAGDETAAETTNGASASSSASKPADPDKVTYTKVNAKQLMDDVANDADKAKQDYYFEYVEVTGVIDSIDSDLSYVTIVPKKGTYFYNVMGFTQDKDQEKALKKYAEGDEITLRGQITLVSQLLGYSMDIYEIL